MYKFNKILIYYEFFSRYLVFFSPIIPYPVIFLANSWFSVYHFSIDDSIYHFALFYFMSFNSVFLFVLFLICKTYSNTFA